MVVEDIIDLNNPKDYVYETLPEIKEGTIVTLLKNNGLAPIEARATNVRIEKGEQYLDLIDNTTNKTLKYGDKPRSWHIKQAIDKGTIVLGKLADYKLCPKCKERYILKEHNQCEDCAIEEKKAFFATRVKMNGEPFKLDDEQTKAVLATRNALVTARAGSGKTRVLTAKLVDLFVNQKIQEEEVLAFCFNRDAAKEIRKRLNSECTVDGEKLFQDYDVVKTFHAFALNVLDDVEGDILVDDRANDRTGLVKQIITNFRANNKTFEDQLNKYFLVNTLKIDHKKFQSKEHYYQFIRNCRYKTLNGEKVRSIPEKIIADFLFEHDIKYIYEWSFYINYNSHSLKYPDYQNFKSFVEKSNKTIPDFYLKDYSIVWEHWGITGRENDNAKEMFRKEVGDYEKYKTTMENKRCFWNSWRYSLDTTNQKYADFSTVSKLIETNPDNFKSEDRDEIECKLKILLESNGVVCKKLSDKEIMSKVWKKAEDSFTRMMVRFIDKFQQLYIDKEEDFIKLAREVKDEREKAFLRLGFLVYKEYTKALSGESDNYPKYQKYRNDFNQCLYKAAEKIRLGEYDDNIKQLKWLLIDEYQDFSELFFNLIDAIISRNSNIMVFCVGDDWQAINGFAGSDLKYFHNFKSYFPNSDRYSVNTNYRSENHIVCNAQEFMNLYQTTKETHKGILPDTGVISEESIKKNNTKKQVDFYDRLTDSKGALKWHEISTETNNSYIEFCSKIINENPGRKIMILNRTNSFLNKDLKEFERVLKNPELCSVDSSNIEVKTVHSAKGEEADIVIITEVDEGKFPVFNPESLLFSIFDGGKISVLEDERRLYYVALTRAKHSLYILYSENSPSSFVKNLKRRS